MPYALSTVGQLSNTYITVPSWTRPTSGTWAVRIKFSVASLAANVHLLGRSDSTAGSLRVLTDGAIRFRDNSIDHITSATGLISVGSVNEVVLTYDTVSDIYELFLNGSSVGTKFYATNSAVFSPCNQAARFSNSAHSEITLYELEFTGGTYSDEWDGTMSAGTGTTGLSVGGTRNLTITNPGTPTDVWWVLYGSSGLTFEAALSSVTSITANLQIGSLFAASLQNVTTISAGLVKPAATFSASLQGQTTVTAALTAPIWLQAAFTSTSSIVATLGGGAPTFAANAGCSTVITADLLVPIYLQSAATNVTSITADLLVPSGLQANLLSQSTITADLKLPIFLGANLQAVSTINAQLSGPASAILASQMVSASSIVANLVVPVLPALFAANMISVSTIYAEMSATGSGQWDLPTIVFNELLPIREIALTFDQQGRPLVFYRVDNDTLKLFWYDASISQNVLLTIGQGINPQACFDYVRYVNYQESDALIAYVRGNSVYYRIFRESFAIEHLVRTFPTPVYLENFGLIEGNKIQLGIKTEGVCEIFITPVQVLDVVQISASVSLLSLVETFTPVDPTPTPPIEDPDPVVPVEPPPVVPPSTRQGYWSIKTTSGGWISGGGWFDQNPGFKTSIKIKKEYKTYGSSFYIAHGCYAIKSPSNQYYSLTFAVFEDAGELYVTYRGNQQKAPRMWSGDIVPKHKVEVEIRTSLVGKIRFYKELADGSGYEAPIEYTFPQPFTDPNFPPFETWPYEKTGFGGLPQHFGSINVTVNTVLVDFVFERENIFNQWVNRFEAPLTQWNVQFQSGFYLEPYKPQYWIEITEA